MKMTYTELRTKSRILCSLTGLTGQEFKALLPSFAAAWDAFVQETFQREGRKRAMGAGRKAPPRDLEDKLLFILVYFRLYPTQAVQGFLFGMSQAQVNEWIHRLTRVLNQALGYERQLPERDPANLETVLSACPSLEFLIDGTERRINRPKDKADRKTYYIGGIKRCQILVQPFRNWVDHYVDDVMETACGLHNFRLTHRAKKGSPLAQAA